MKSGRFIRLAALALGALLGHSSIIYPAWAEGGSMAGGGGGAIVCPKADGTLKPSKLIDLAETEFHDKKFKVNVSFSSMPWRKIVEYVTTRIGFLDPAFNSALRWEVSHVVYGVPGALSQTAGTDEVFPAPPDLGAGRLPPLPLGCQIAGAAQYSDDNQEGLGLSEIIWNSFDDINKAALVLHEAVYRVERMTGKVLVSSDVRKFIGLIFSQEFADFTVNSVENTREYFRTNLVLIAPIYPKADEPSSLKMATEVKIQEILDKVLPASIQDRRKSVYLNSLDDKVEFVVRESHHKNLSCVFSISDMGAGISANERFERALSGKQIGFEDPMVITAYRIRPFDSVIYTDHFAGAEMLAKLRCRDTDSGVKVDSWIGSDLYYYYQAFHLSYTTPEFPAVEMDVDLGPTFEIRSKERYAKDFLADFKLED